MKFSGNITVALITMIIGILKYWAPELSLDPEGLIAVFAEGNISTIIMFVLNAITPIIKIVQNQLWKDKGFLKSRNFLTQAATVLGIIGDMAFGAGTTLSGLVAHTVNYFVHLFEPKTAT